MFKSPRLFTCEHNISRALAYLFLSGVILFGYVGGTAYAKSVDYWTLYFLSWDKNDVKFASPQAACDAWLASITTNWIESVEAVLTTDINGRCLATGNGQASKYGTLLGHEALDTFQLVPEQGQQCFGTAQSGPSTQEGNPIDAATGIKLETVTDITLGDGLSFRRTYRSVGNANATGELGVGWSHNLARQVDADAVSVLASPSVPKSSPRFNS